MKDILREINEKPKLLGIILCNNQFKEESEVQNLLRSIVHLFD